MSLKRPRRAVPEFVLQALEEHDLIEAYHARPARRQAVKIMERQAMFLICCLALWVSGCSSEEVTNSEVQPAKSVLSTTWVAIEPVQCLGNPWEQDWLERNDWDYDAYPRDPTRFGLEPQEFEIIQDYYDSEGVVVFDGQTAPKYNNVCLACSCPEGHTLYLLVREQDVAVMVGWGYRVESPAQE